MKIFAITGGMLGIPTIQELIKAKLLTGIGIPVSNDQYLQQVIGMANAANVPVTKLKQKSLKRDLQRVLEQQKVDLVLVLTFPYKIPEQVLAIPQLGFLNYHCAQLPKYRGPRPNFWEIKNQEKYSAVTVHQMDADFDTGPIIYEEKVRIEPHFTHGMLSIKHSYMMVKATQMVFMQLQQLGGKFDAKPQSTTGAKYYPKPKWNDFTIDWENQSASEIKALIRACNPEYQGAIAKCKDLMLRVYAFSGTDVKNDAGHKPGTILTLNSTDGLCVACKTGVLRLEIVALEEGVLMAHQLAKIGFAVGDCFQNAKVA